MLYKFRFDRLREDDRPLFEDNIFLWAIEEKIEKFNAVVNKVAYCRENCIEAGFEYKAGEYYYWIGYDDNINRDIIGHFS